MCGLQWFSVERRVIDHKFPPVGILWAVFPVPVQPRNFPFSFSSLVPIWGRGREALRSALSRAKCPLTVMAMYT